MQTETRGGPHLGLHWEEYDIGYQRSNLEGEISGILQGEVFDEEHFNKFFDNIFLLVGGLGSQNLRVANIEDEENNTVIELRRRNLTSRRKIMITQKSQKDDGTVVFSLKRLTYRIDDVYNVRQPHLYSSDLQYNSPIANMTVRNLCLGIITRYLVLQNRLHIQLQSSVR